jgi:hypothetical protein
MQKGTLNGREVIKRESISEFYADNDSNDGGPELFNTDTIFTVDGS